MPGKEGNGNSLTRGQESQYVSTRVSAGRPFSLQTYVRCQKVILGGKAEAEHAVISLKSLATKGRRAIGVADGSIGPVEVLFILLPHLLFNCVDGVLVGKGSLFGVGLSIFVAGNPQDAKVPFMLPPTE